MEVCSERCVNPRCVALEKLSIHFSKMKVCFESGASRRNHLGADSLHSRSKPRFAHLCSKQVILKMAVCFESGANPKHHRWLGFAPLSKQTAILGVSTVRCRAALATLPNTAQHCPQHCPTLPNTAQHCPQHCPTLPNTAQHCPQHCPTLRV